MKGGPLMIVEHVGTFVGMLIAMLLRLDEYAGAGHRHGTAQQAIAA
jgi:hypothetical protein